MKRKEFIVSILCTILLVGGCSSNKSTNEKTSNTNENNAEVTSYLEKVETYYSQGNYSEAIKILDEAKSKLNSNLINNEYEMINSVVAIQEANQDDLIASGKDGDLYWSIDQDGLLTIAGSGDYKGDYINDNGLILPQWIEYSNNIQEANVDVVNITNCCRFFDGLENLISLDLSNFDTSKVTDMYCMFLCCENLTELDLSNFDTSNVTNMESMFGLCESLTSLDLTNFDTSKVTNMESMFSVCESLVDLDVSSFDTSNVVTMELMFRMCTNIEELDLSSFNTSNVTNMTYMFSCCYNLKTLNISNFTISDSCDTRAIMEGCDHLSKSNLGIDYYFG